MTPNHWAAKLQPGPMGELGVLPIWMPATATSQMGPGQEPSALCCTAARQELRHPSSHIPDLEVTVAIA